MDTKALRQKILDLAIHGRLVPQDPADEPASVLLQRIREEKERLAQEGKIKKGKKAVKTAEAGHCENVPFDVPESWEWTTLGEIGTWQAGATPSRLQTDYYGGNIPWLKTGDLTDGIITSIPENITEKALQETSVKLNPTGSILIAMYGATIGKIGILSFPATTNQACCACVDYKVEQMYLFYFLLANRNNFIAMGGGGAQPNISKDKIINTLIPLPPLPEQHRIVKEIERWFSLIDIIESGKESLKSAVKQAKAKILDLAIHGRLVPQDPTDEPASVLLQRIREEKERLAQEGKIKKEKKAAKAAEAAQCENVPFEVPESWKWTTLGEMIQIKSGDSINVRNNQIGKFPIYGGNGISGSCNNFNIDTTTIVIGRVGFYCGSVHKVNQKAWVTDNAFITNIIGGGYDEYFLYFLLQQCQLRNYSNSTAQPVISGKTIYPIVVPLPPLSEQRRIVEKIEQLFAQLDKIEGEL